MPMSLPLFLVLFTWVLLSIALGLKFYEWWRKREVSAMLEQAAQNPGGSAKLLRDPAPVREPAVSAWLRRLSLFASLETTIRQAGLDWTPGGLLVLMAGGAVAGAILALILPEFMGRIWTAVILMPLLAALPYLHLRRQKNKRLAGFEEQFPEALDFLARSMRAGHAFTISLKMVSEDSPEPLAMEFRTLFNQQNLGVPLETALVSLTERIPLLDVRFFASAVILQKQTGGNLGEILTRLGYVIRERFQLKGRVRAASAHGRITATVLAILPLATAVVLLIAAPGYLQSMAADPDGRMLIAASFAGQIVGQIVIRKIVGVKA
jgi:tight adherence protein B